MTDKLVTHADANTIEDARRWISNVPVGQEAISGKARVLDLLDRLRAAAEADEPPLPEGWVVERHPDGTSRTVWHKDGMTSMWSDGTYPTVTGFGSRLTPLRPAITAEDVERATAAVRKHQGTVTYEVLANLVVDALGIEVTS